MKPLSGLLCLVATATYVGLSTAQTQPPTYNPPAKNFTQKLNHKADDNVTFSQLYQLDTTHFKPGGPIFFHQSEENPYMAPLDISIVADFAAKLGGISAVLEHRFFGTSLPAGKTQKTLTTQDYKSSLTLENVMQDSVEFVKWIKKTVPGAENSPVIYGAGSYGGFLAVMARIHYPETFYGSIAWAPILRGWGSSKTVEENPFKFTSTDFIANTYWDTNYRAALKIKQAMKIFDDCIKANNCATALADFELCTKPTTQADWYALKNLIIYPQYINLPQFSFVQGGGTYPPDALHVLTNATAQATSPGKVLRAPIDAYIALKTNGTCIDSAKLLGGSGGAESFGMGAAWDYISCSYLFLGGDAVGPENSLFPPFMDKEEFTGCNTVAHSDWVDAETRNFTNDEWIDKYNISDGTIDKTTRLLIIHGSLDRISALGSPKLTLSSDRNQSRVIVVSGMGHGPQSYSEKKQARGLQPPVDEVRDTQLAYIQSWLGIEATEDRASGNGPGAGTGGTTVSTNAARNLSRSGFLVGAVGCLGALIAQLV